MSDSDTPDDDTARTSRPGDAEPVDAEFEPAPDDGPKNPADARKDRPKKSGGGGFKLVLFVIVSAAIGGAAGFALTRYLPAEAGPGGDISALEDRLAAVESQSAPDLSQLTERVVRLESVVQARDGLAGRVDTLAASVERLEQQISSGPASPGEDGGQTASPALDALETRIGEAFTQVQERLDALEDDIDTVRGEADAARSAAQQANAALSSLSAGSGSDAAAGEAGVSDRRVAALAGRVDALDSALAEVRAALSDLQDLPQRIDALAARLSDVADSADAAPDGASQQALAELQSRLGALAQDLSDVSGRVTALDRAGPAAASPAVSEPPGLAARALAFAALSEAASGSQPFAVELEALARVWPEAPGVQALRLAARAGAPTADRLETTFPADALREATGETRTYFGVLRVARDDNAGPAAAIEQALAQDDLAEAARRVAELDEAGLTALGDWRAGLAARLAVRQALTQQSAALAAAGDRQ